MHEKLRNPCKQTVCLDYCYYHILSSLNNATCQISARPHRLVKPTITLQNTYQQPHSIEEETELWGGGVTYLRIQH